MMHETAWSGGHVMGFGGPWLFMLLWIIFIVPPFWRIFSKAGFSGWLSLLMLVPLANVIVLYIVAFSDWPSLKYARADAGHVGNDEA